MTSISAFDQPTRLRTRTSWWRIIFGIGLSFVSLLMLALSLPTYGLWPLMFVAFVPMVIAQNRVLPPKLSSLAVAITFAGYAGIFFNVILDTAPALPSYWRVLPILLLGVYTMLTSMENQSFHARTGYRWVVPHGIVSWLGMTLIFVWVPFAATWPFLSNVLYGQPWLLQPISLFGMFALEALVLLVNYTLGLVALAVFDRRWRLDAAVTVVPTTLARRWLLITGGIVAAWITLSLALFRTPTGPTMRVAALQPNQEAFMAPDTRLGDYKVWQQEVSIPTLPVLVEQTREAARNGAHLIVWPERALSFDPVAADHADLKALAVETGAYIALPYLFDTPDGLRNEVTIIDPQGTFLGVYQKSHPTPGEMSPRQRTYPVYDTPIGRITSIICYDLDYLDTTRAMVANGAQVIAAPSADWSSITDFHYTHLVFRAVENRVAMVKADLSFDSAVIDPYGRIMALTRTPEGSKATLLVDVPLGTGPTLATSIGDVFGWVGFIGMILFAVAIPINKRRAAKAK